MSERPEPEGQRQEPTPEKATYRAPRLVRHGTIQDLTGGGVAATAGDPTSIPP
jgi:hypothetical protein